MTEDENATLSWQGETRKQYLGLGCSGKTEVALRSFSGAIQSDGQVVERLALRGVVPRTAAQSHVARFRPLYAGGVLAAREPPPQMLTVTLNHTPLFQWICKLNASVLHGLPRPIRSGEIGGVGLFAG